MTGPAARPTMQEIQPGRLVASPNEKEIHMRIRKRYVIPVLASLAVLAIAGVASAADNVVD